MSRKIKSRLFTYLINFKCSKCEKGNMNFSEIAFPTNDDINSRLFHHTCENCGYTEYLKDKFPHISYTDILKNEIHKVYINKKNNSKQGEKVMNEKDLSEHQKKFRNGKQIIQNPQKDKYKDLNIDDLSFFIGETFLKNYFKDNKDIPNRDLYIILTEIKNLLDNMSEKIKNNENQIKNMKDNKDEFNTLFKKSEEESDEIKEKSINKKECPKYKKRSENYDPNYKNKSILDSIYLFLFKIFNPHHFNKNSNFRNGYNNQTTGYQPKDNNDEKQERKPPKGGTAESNE